MMIVCTFLLVKHSQTRANESDVYVSGALDIVLTSNDKKVTWYFPTFGGAQEIRSAANLMHPNPSPSSCALTNVDRPIRFFGFF